MNVDYETLFSHIELERRLSIKNCSQKFTFIYLNIVEIKEHYKGKEFFVCFVEIYNRNKKVTKK